MLVDFQTQNSEAYEHKESLKRVLMSQKSPVESGLDGARTHTSKAHKNVFISPDKLQDRASTL